MVIGSREYFRSVGFPVCEIARQLFESIFRPFDDLKYRATRSRTKLQIKLA